MANDRGVFAIDRALYNGPDRHPFFKDETFTEREAWVWMIGECAFETCQRRIGRGAHDLKRGQYVAATRFMATKWQWTESRVRRFLERLKEQSMIVAAPTSEATIITVCNYDDYQFGRRTDDAPAAGPRRKEEQLQETQGGGGEPRPRGGTISEEAHAFANEMAVICGLDPTFLPPHWISAGPALRVQLMLNSGWQIDVMREAAKAAVRVKRDGPPKSILYFDKIFARAHAPQLPLPIAQAVREDPKHATDRPSDAPTDFRGSRDAFRTARAGLKAHISAAEQSPSAGGEEGGGQIIRLTAAPRCR